MIKLQLGLNYNNKDKKFILLGNVFKCIESEKTKDRLNRVGFKLRSKAVKYKKIFFTSLFFNYEVSRVIDELNNKRRAKKFCKNLWRSIEQQVSEYF